MTASSDTTATTTATGNSFVGSVVTGGVVVTSTQSISGAVQAQTVLNVTTDAGPSTNLTTAATGNSGELGDLRGGRAEPAISSRPPPAPASTARARSMARAP